MSTAEIEKEIARIMERVHHEVVAVVLSLPQAEPVTKIEGLMKIAAACKYLECSETQLRQMVKDGLLPERRVGNRLRFKSEELDASTVRTRLKKVV